MRFARLPRVAVVLSLLLVLAGMLASRVKESQTLSMDAVSSATVTSTALLKAIQIAVSR